MTHNQLARNIAARFAQLTVVEAAAIAGSQVTGWANSLSDIDVYIYSSTDIPASERLAIGREFSQSAQLIDFWGPGIEFDDDASGVHADIVFFQTGFMEDQLDRILRRCEAWVGYSTCFWHTVRVSQSLYDRAGWFAALQQQAQQPYPELLVRHIIAVNFPVLRDTFSSYMHQIEKAVSRDDQVSLNHRAAGLLASYFDVLFALNHLPHPGEKRLMVIAERDCALRPDHMQADIQSFLRATLQPAQIIAAGNRLIDGMESLLQREGFLPDPV